MHIAWAPCTPEHARFCMSYSHWQKGKDHCLTSRQWQYRLWDACMHLPESDSSSVSECTFKTGHV